ncbi:His/Gly/Thr/Pro-type tRNA ligase C-terminal domain-containing protein [Natronoglycomyces albus]|uniref:Anticodon-binding domain-containing protein n=1 Tax=Natronoglycomyces albus TaxID=2811108 RepID=A0A895XWS1_9ACTN|nr:His/Gly/Thr/Pro-type tRNA ligase C-terminal domain-containing protein [Natronoglycomyces albus]QSB06078.1 hypothetical protein JQS30_03935 [Natronoglycomyces albus]
MISSSIIDLEHDERPGAKFADVELIGLPYRFTIGARGPKEGTVEFTQRGTATTSPLPIDQAAPHLMSLLAKS